MRASNAPRRGQSVSELLNTSVSVFRATLLKCLPFAMIAVLCAEIPSFYWIATGRSLDHGLPMEPTYWWLVTLATAVALYIFSAMMLRQLYFSGGFAVNARQELTLAARRLPSLLFTWLLMQVTLFIGFLLIVPGVFLLICYMVLLPVVLLEGQLNPVLALRRCVMLVLPNWWRVCASLVITLVVMGVCFLVFAALMSVLAQLLTGSAFQAIFAAGTIAFFATLVVFLSALALAVHSSANSSA
jgi:hypothetical protein